MNKKITFLFFLLVTHSISSQIKTFKIPDSLADKNFDYLDERIYELKKDSAKAGVYLYTYLTKAKNEQNWKEIVNGYQNLLHVSPEKFRLVYADSMIYFAEKSSDKSLIGSAYLSKGIVYYGQKKHNSALDNYIIANNFISQTNDKYLIHKVKYHLALIKYYLGFYEEAVSLLKECVNYFKDENPRAYLNSLHSLGISYNKIGDYELCSKTNAQGISDSKSLNLPEMKPFFIHSEGINQYFKKNYGAAIRKIEYSLDEITRNNDFANISIANFYIGKSYWALNQKNKALLYFQKVDQIFNDRNYIRTDLREVYEILIKYYKTKNDFKAQLYYIDQLLLADSQLNQTSKYLINKVYKEYDTVELLSEKDEIQEELSRKKYSNYILVAVILCLYFLLIVLVYRHFKNKTIYKQKFDELMLKINEGGRQIAKEKIDILEINPEAAASILKQLEKFEHEQKFLERDLSLVKLAASFNSNTKYISKVIYHYRNKGFVEYINDLKIDYVISLLKNDKKTRNYTNKALAEEAGFTSTQRFANAFFSKTEMPTSYFIAQINKSAE